VGFNVELKWDMEHRDGSRESHNAFEMNLFVDTVLKTVMEHAGVRKIVFSSFNPDVCYA
jgi:glycerophosphocholine phosphodiesterase GPCPD1